MLWDKLFRRSIQLKSNYLNSKVSVNGSSINPVSSPHWRGYHNAAKIGAYPCRERCALGPWCTGRDGPASPAALLCGESWGFDCPCQEHLKRNWPGMVRQEERPFFKMVRGKWFLNGGFIVCLSIEIFVLCHITLAYVWHVSSGIWDTPAAPAVHGVPTPLVGPIAGHSKRHSQITQNLFLLWKMQATAVEFGKIHCLFFQTFKLLLKSQDVSAKVCSGVEKHMKIS